MGKFKNFIEEQKTDLRALLFNYTFTLIAIAILSIVLCIDYEMETPRDFIQNIELCLAIFAAGAVFIETFFVHKNEEKNWGRLAIYYIVNAILAVIWTILAYYIEDIADRFDNSDIFCLNFTKLFVVYIIGLLAVTLYKLVKLSGLKIDTYFSRAIFGLLKTWGLFFVLYLAICLLLSIFGALIMEIEYWDILDNISILLVGFVCFPYSLLTITDTKEENSKFTKGLINVALMPATIAAFLIVYMYIIKILVSWNMPSNEVFYICLYVFILGGPVWFMSYGFLREKAEARGEEIGLYGKIVKNMKYAYAPLIILEIISIGIRIANYGLTTQRYLAIVAIIFQIVYVLWDVIGKVAKKELKEEGLIIVGLGIFAFIMLCPGLNMDKLPAEIQIDRFEEAIEDEDYVTAGGVYTYLKFDDYGEVYLKENYSIEEIDALELIFYDYADEDDEYMYKEYIFADVPDEVRENGMNIAGYTNIYWINGQIADYGEIYSEEELKAISISFGNDPKQRVENVDITSVVEYVIKLKEEDINYNMDMDYQYIKIGNNCCVIIDFIKFNYNTATGEITDLAIDGYVLTNEGGHNGQ